MTLTIIASLVLASGRTIDQASDFFPLHTGDVYNYEDVIQKETYPVTVRIGEAGRVEEHDYVPMIVDAGTGQPETTRYWYDGDAVKMLFVSRVPKKAEKGAPAQPKVIDPRTGLETDAPTEVVTELDTPTVFKLPDVLGKWAYTGRTILMSDAASLQLLGNSRRLGQRNVLGRKRDVIEVTLDQKVGASDGPVLKSHSVNLYARGIGLYEMTETNTIGKRSVERHRTLVSYSGKS